VAVPRPETRDPSPDMEATLRDIIIKSILGGLMIALILTLARLRQYVIAGLLVSVPTISLYTFWWIGKDQGAEAMRVAIRAALCGAGPWALYLLVAYLLAPRLPAWAALGAGVVAYLSANAVVWLFLRK
jgi:uncharacterized membrane protein (GlpM family)